MNTKRLGEAFFTRDALTVALELLNKILVRKLPSGELLRFRITETEAYCGEEDAACHARAGKTKRTAVMYERGGHTYVYLCYGLHHLLNVVTGPKDFPEAVLIRGGISLVGAPVNYDGPAKLTKVMKIDRSQNGIDLITSDELWIEDDGVTADYITTKRIGIDYAAEPYKSIEWRFVTK